MEKRHILLVDDMVTSTKMMSVILHRENFDVTAFNNPIEAFQWLKIPSNRPDAIVTDLNMPEMDGAELVKRTRGIPELATIPILVLSAETDKDRVLACLKAGADDYILKPVRGPKLLERLNLLFEKAANAGTGSTGTALTSVGVFSLRGGVGTTSLAVNLAAAFRGLWGDDTLLFDASSKNSHGALWLGLQPKDTLVKFASHPDAMAEEQFSDLLLTHKSGVFVLPAPAFAYDSAKINATMVNTAWGHVVRKFSFAVVDGGNDLTPAVYSALTHCQRILLMLAPDKGSVVAAKYIFQLMHQLKYDTNHLLPVVNHVFGNGALSDKAIEDELPGKIVATIPHDSLLFVEAINSGVPFVEANPLSEVSLAIAKLAYTLSPDTLKENPPETPSVLLKEVQKDSA